MNHDARLRPDLRKIFPVLSNMCQSVVSGVILALLFFAAREIWLPLPSVTGRWTLEMRTTQTTYRPYEDMTVRYVAILWREGPVIKGTIEKTSDVTSAGEEIYTAESRTRGDIEGYIHKLYFSKDRITMHIVEHGELRQFTHFHDLTVENSDRMAGTFIATAADSEGEVTWQRPVGNMTELSNTGTKGRSSDSPLDLVASMAVTASHPPTKMRITNDKSP